MQNIRSASTNAWPAFSSPPETRMLTMLTVGTRCGRVIAGSTYLQNAMRRSTGHNEGL